MLTVFTRLSDSVVGHWRWGDAMAKPRDDRQKDLLRPALEDIIDLGHPLARLAREIDWQFLDGRFASVCAPGAGQPPLPTRLVAVHFEAHARPVGRSAVWTDTGRCWVYVRDDRPFGGPDPKTAAQQFFTDDY
jgi:hypothetical protein